MIHTGFKKGKKVCAITKDGSIYIGKFIDSTSKQLILDNVKINLGKLRSATIYKNRGVE